MGTNARILHKTDSAALRNEVVASVAKDIIVHETELEKGEEVLPERRRFNFKILEPRSLQEAEDESGKSKPDAQMLWAAVEHKGQPMVHLIDSQGTPACRRRKGAKGGDLKHPIAQGNTAGELMAMGWSDLDLCKRCRISLTPEQCVWISQNVPCVILSAC